MNVGGKFTLSVVIANAGGPYDPPELELYLFDPKGNTTKLAFGVRQPPPNAHGFPTGSIVKDSTGNYHVDMTPPDDVYAGNYKAFFLAKGTPFGNIKSPVYEFAIGTATGFD